MNIAAVRLPRFERQPAAIPTFEVTERDEDILRIVARHRFIRSYSIVDMVAAQYPGTSEQKILRRLHLLFHGGFLLRPKAQVENYRAGAGSRPLVYMLNSRGIDLLSTKYGFRRSAISWAQKARTTSRGELEHALEVTDFMVALALACQKHGGLEVIYFDEIMRELAPPETRRNSRPYHWPVSVPWQGKEVELYVIPDKIFGIRDRSREPGRDKKFFMLEADRGTQPVIRRNLTQSSVSRKLIGYAHTFRGDLHKSIYGLPNMRVLIVTTGRKRITSIIAAHRQHTAALVSPRLFLMAERKTLLGAGDFLVHPWLDAAGEEHFLLS